MLYKVVVNEPMLLIVQPKIQQIHTRIQETFVIKNQPQIQKKNEELVSKEYIQQVVREVMRQNKQSRKRSRRK